MVNHLTRLDECYERGLLRKVAASNDKAMQSLAQAREWVIEAGYDCDAGSLRSALMAAYMGYFHAARAVLFRDGVREKSHYCIGVHLEPIMKRDCWRTFGSYNSIISGDYSRVISTVLMPARLLRKSANQ